MADQPRLFDLPEPKPDTRHPGQLPFVEWLKRPETVYHSSFRKDWEEGPSAHVGSQVAASDRLVQSAVNISAKSTDAPEGGRTWARRLAKPVGYTTQSDAALNAAQWHLELHNEPPETAGGKHFSEKEGADIRSAAMALSAGQPVAYRNAFEDVGTTSALAPRGSLRAWHEDVAEAVEMGLDVHPHDIALAKQQFDPAIAITPRSMGHNVESYTNRYYKGGSRAEQLSAIPYSTVIRDEEGKVTSEKLFPIHATDVDKDAWGQTHPGMEAGERARAFAESSGQELGFGVRARKYSYQQTQEEYEAEYRAPLEGLTHMERSHHEAMERKRPAMIEKLRQKGWRTTSHWGV